MAIARMRTAKQVVDEIRKLDPDTALSFNFVRQMIHDEVVPVLCIGRKKLVNLDDVIEYLETGIAKNSQPAADAARERGVIRRVV